MKLCIQCNHPFKAKETLQKFCNRSCAAKYNNAHRSTVSREKAKATLIKLAQEGKLPQQQNRKVQVTNIPTECKICKGIFPNQIHHPCNRLICSTACYSKHVSMWRKGKVAHRTVYNGKPISSSEYRRFRFKSEFRFDPNQEPNVYGYDEFINLGKWHPKTNPQGVVRDHMFSVKQGWVDDIDPSILRHPANCNWITLSANSTKVDHCSITLAELMDRIDKWGSDYHTRGDAPATWEPIRRSQSKTVNKNRPTRKKNYKTIQIIRNGEIKSIKQNQLSAYKKCGWSSLY